MARKRKTTEEPEDGTQEHQCSNDNTKELDEIVKEVAALNGGRRGPEEAARAYDEAACLLRGSNTRTNFWPSFNSSSSAPLTPALPSKISNLLLHKLKSSRNNLNSCSSISNHQQQQHPHQQQQLNETDELAHETPLTEFFDEPASYTAAATYSDYMNMLSFDELSLKGEYQDPVVGDMGMLKDLETYRIKKEKIWGP
ncbi:ethylene-responsive transcription factor ERN1-like [Papaver somniferum]|uniref:ethylene-responsive transcription factor ERN1-like n=1 Tax=Papaver somniferum TaxID=3469 RepID=UPI000E6F9515|nr:ethylene-responsive transcription factor ERN1-like [Papaver somniferum]